MILNLESLKKSGLTLHNQNEVTIIGDIQFEAPTFIAARLRFDTVLHIGSFCNLNHNTEIGHTKIGRYSSIGQNCFIGGDKHPTDWLSTSRLFYVSNFREFAEFEEVSNFTAGEFRGTGDPVIIGNDVLIANSCIISRGVTIGDGAIIAPGSVVTKSIPPYTIAGGSPAKVIKDRFDEKTTQRLMELKWWNYSLKSINNGLQSNINEFLGDMERRHENLELFNSKFILNNDNIRDFLK